MAQSVELYVYDISMGLGGPMITSLTGIQTEAVYHSSVVFSNLEFFFGGGMPGNTGIAGISWAEPGCSQFGTPIKKLTIGFTEVPLELFLEFLRESSDCWQPNDYDLIRKNCNHFSQDAIAFLTGQDIPKHIVDQGMTLISTPIGQMLEPMLKQFIPM
ncbi:hypothetical protein PCE1_000764 [Barthelona sp. PCE]